MSGYRLLDHELASLDEDLAAGSDEHVAEPAPATEPEPEPEAEPDVVRAIPAPRDLAYTVRLFDAALLVIDTAEISADALALPDLLSTRDRALRR